MAVDGRAARLGDPPLAIAMIEGAASLAPLFVPALELDVRHDAAPPPAGQRVATDALLEAIYQSALNPEHLARLRTQLLFHFREDRSRDDTPLTRVILGHIQRALRLGATHSAMQRERQRLLEVIDAVAPPIIVVDESLRVLGLNRDAEALMGSDAVFAVEEGRLVCRESGFLPALIAQARCQPYVSARVGHATPTGSQQGLLVYIYKNRVTQDDAAPASYSLLLLDRHRCIQQSIAGLGRRAGLTAREIEIIDFAIQGLDLDAICERARITLHTLRQHIKNIYTKTGVHNQNALFALVLRNIVLEQAAGSQNAKLLPHITGLAHSRRLRLPDGRQLSYAEYGAPNGLPVLYFHALNASRLELLMHADRLRDLGVRLIAMDRPGYGHSTFAERRDYRDFTADVRSLLDELHVDQAHVLSASAGTAHALHAAWALPDRIRSVHCTAVVPPIGYILASDSPSTLNSLMNQFFRVVPSLLRPAMELALFGQTVESLLTAMTSTRQNNVFSLTEADVAYITAPEHLPYFVASMMESLRQGARAFAMESVLINRDWSIDLRELKVPVHLWHGSHDGLVPTDMVTAFAKAVPNARLTVLEGDTHLLVLRNIERLVAAIHRT
jgi:pimeloyl-ACP methyl ester carboxylesterase/DNA-binding CsgD family transcriptional regulator